jgi:hypothetical protein
MKVVDLYKHCGISYSGKEIYSSGPEISILFFLFFDSYSQKDATEKTLDLLTV